MSGFVAQVARLASNLTALSLAANSLDNASGDLHPTPHPQYMQSVR